MGLETHIARRGSRYYFRIRVPDDLIGLFGRRELKRSLGTASQREARFRALQLRQIAYTGFRTLRENPMLKPNQITRIARAFYEQCLDLDDDVRARSKGGVYAQCLHGGLKDNRQQALGMFKAAIADGNHSFVQQYLDSAIAEENLDIAKGSKDYDKLGQALMQALIEANKRMLARDGGDFRDIPSDPLIRVGALVSN
ncbi:MAG: hypothetical protein HQL44_16200, partial [Alphaproteobacteria bacterium]|nr:hypothetical protein [Alphaproteobacteria bacterium]